MIDRLLQLLTASQESPDATELADALWLVRHLPPRRSVSPGTSTADPAPRPIRPAAAGGAGVGRPRAPLAGLYLTEPRGTAPEARRPGGHLAGNAGTLAGVPAIPAIPGAAAVTRALRPLRARVAGLTRGVVDEDATARNIADSGLWLPELLPDPERWMDLVLVIDDSASMRVWRRTVAEFRELLIHLAAFRDIRIETINTDEDTTVLRLGPGTARRLVLVLTDCVGSAWTKGSVRRSLEAAQRAGPMAIVQMLPQRLWAGCGLSFVPVRIGADPARAAPPRIWDRSTGAEVRGPGPAGADPEGRGAPIPVLELDARWLGPWAAMLGGQARHPIAGMAVFTRSEPVPVQQHKRLSGSDRVALFRSVASPTALQLAMYLAAAPLSLPVMRLVQYVMLPRSRPADLAEVFLSGLLHRVGDAGPGAAEFDFQPDVRKILLSGLRRAEAVRVYRLVSAYVDDRLGSTPEFQAIFGSAGPVPGPTPGSGGSLTDPFGAVTLTVLRSVGGQYKEIADKLAAGPSGPSGYPVGEPGTAAIPSTGGPAVSEPSVSRPPRLWRGVPSKNPNFTGRDDLLLTLRSQLSEERLAAIVPIALRGLGGVGKTQVALEYVYRFAAEYDLICWVSGEVPSQLRAGLAALAPDLGIPSGGDLDMLVTAVGDALNRGEPYRRWLLVVDNADDPGSLMPYLPQAYGHILITSRNQTWGDYARTYPVAEFTREESISLIRRRGRDISEADANLLADRLGDLPIAVEQAAAWQAETGMTVLTYLNLLDKQMSTLLAENPPPGYKLSIVAAWTLAFEDLQTLAPEGAALVQLCAFLGPDPIPYGLLWAFRRASGLPQDLESMLREEFTFHRAIRQAGQRALLKNDAGQQTLTEHRLVQAVLRERLSAEQRAEMTRLAWQVLITANPGRPDDQGNWKMLATINSHLGATRLIDFDDRAARAVIVDQIRYLYNYGDQSSSRELAEEAIRRWREHPGPYDEQTLIASRLLGIVRRELGQVEEARAINEDTLNKTREVFGEEHEHTLITANSYACDLRIAGDYAEALELDERLYEQHKAEFGENEDSTFRSAHNLAIDHRLTGRFDLALRLDEETLRRRHEVLGDQRWETWSSAGAVARDLRNLGEFAEAKRRLQDAIGHCGRLLGPDHPEVVRMRMDYALILRRLGELPEAIQVAEACVELNRSRLGRNHNYTLAIMTTLAQALRLAGDTGSALGYAKQVMEAAAETYGAHHTLYGTCQHNYAIALRADGDFDQARELDRQVNQRYHAVMEGRRRTLSSDVSLARDLELSGDAAAAEDLLRRVLETSKTTRGAHHSRTLYCATNLSRLLRARHSEDEAARIAGPAIAELRELFRAGQPEGFEHPEVAMAEAGEFIEMEMDIPDR